jgi:putative spermidine/putrescine transport system permease protein
MTTASNTQSTLVTKEGKSLKEAITQANKAARNRALLLVMPLLIFLILTFVMPIIYMLIQAASNEEIPNYLPNTVEAIASWDESQSANGLPDEAVYAAMHKDLVAGRENRTIGKAAGVINRSVPGTRGQLIKSAKKAKKMEPPFKEALIADNPKWAELPFWRFIQRESGAFTINYFLKAVDRAYDKEGNIVQAKESNRVYLKIFLRTIIMSILITGMCVLLAYPVAYLLSISSVKKANLLMILVLLPFWTSLLVRTSAWMVLLGQQGVINETLIAIGLIDDSSRLSLIYNATGTFIAMVHILLPFMILPLYSVMKTINPSYLRAATSMGSHPFRAWWKVYFPLTLPGMAAGVILVFILAIGYYITPALLGGAEGIFISNLIADNMKGTTANFKIAMALASILLIGVLLLYWVFNKLVGVDRLKFG